MNLKIKDFLIDRDKTMIEKLTGEKQTVNGKFAPGNSLGKKFPSGVSGNPRGRPKNTHLTDALRQQLSELNPNASDQTIAEQIAQTLITLALSGDVQAIKEVFDRCEGKPKQSIDLDVQATNWQEEARRHGITESEIVRETRLLLAEYDAVNGDEATD
jgi:hypothetical protein